MVKRLSSIFTQIVLPNLGIDIMWSSDNRIYLSVDESMFGKVFDYN